MKEVLYSEIYDQRIIDPVYSHLPVRMLLTSTTKRQLQKLNIALREIVGQDREARLQLVSHIFGRHFDSTLDLQLCEIRAFLLLAYPDGGRVMAANFHQFLMEEAFDYAV